MSSSLVAMQTLPHDTSTYKIVEECGRFYVYEKGALWGWNKCLKKTVCGYGSFHSFHLSFDTKEEALTELRAYSKLKRTFMKKPVEEYYIIDAYGETHKCYDDGSRNGF